MSDHELDSLLGDRHSSRKRRNNFGCFPIGMISIGLLVVAAIVVMLLTRADPTSKGDVQRKVQTQFSHAYYLMGKWIGMRQDMAGINAEVKHDEDDLKRVHAELTRDEEQIKALELKLKELPVVQAAVANDTVSELRQELADYVHEELDKATVTLANELTSQDIPQSRSVRHKSDNHHHHHSKHSQPSPSDAAVQSAPTTSVAMVGGGSDLAPPVAEDSSAVQDFNLDAIGVVNSSASALGPKLVSVTKKIVAAKVVPEQKITLP